MISVVYNVGGSCIREDARKVMTLTAKQPIKENPEKPEDWVTINAIAVFLAYEDAVYTFYKNGETLDECNDTVAMGTYELDLRLYELFGAHTNEEFMGMRDAGRRNSVEFREEDGQELPVPVAETKARKKAEAAEKKKAARNAKKASN